jgi:Cu+-exporting ATPase
MDTLVAIGTSASYFYSMYAVIGNIIAQKSNSGQFFETSIFLIFFILVGKYLEHYAKGQTTNSVKALYDLTPDTAELVTVDEDMNVLTNQTIAMDLVQMGDLLKVNAGARISCDGVIISGQSYIDESMITGESIPVFKKVGHNVIGGTVNQSGSILVKVLKIGSETTLARIIALMQDAQSSRAPIQEIADKISRIFVPGVLLVALLTFIVWAVIILLGFVVMPEGKTWLSFSIEHAVAVLVIACPCALGLATPTAVMVGSGGS